MTKSTNSSKRCRDFLDADSIGDWMLHRLGFNFEAMTMAKIGLLAVPVSVLVLGLAACSGGGGAPTDGAVGGGGGGDGGPTTGDGDGSGDGSGDGDSGGVIGNDFSSARNAMEAVREEITAIETLAPTVQSDAERTAVRNRIVAARAQYRRAFDALERVLAAAEDGSDEFVAATGYLFRINQEANLDRLTAAEVAVADKWLAGLIGPSRDTAINPMPSAEVLRFKRAEADGTAIPDSDRLSIQTDGIMHSAGKTVISAQGTGITDELPARGITLRVAGNQWRRWNIQGRDATPNALGNTDGILDYSVELTASGLVYKVRGNAVYYDFQRRFDVGLDADDWYGRGPDGERGTADDGANNGKWDGCWTLPDPTLDCTNWIHDDMQVTFGAPSASLSGVTAFYWNTRIPFPDGSSVDTPHIAEKIAGHDAVRADADMGTYELWLSNFGGVDRGLEPSVGFHPDDDVDRFLEYAAYGLFTYTDLIVSARGPGRQQALHFGYDAFADEDGLKTTDIEEDDTITATFRGATMAHQYLAMGTTSPVRVDIRGDILLNARIGSGANKISGEITNLAKREVGGSWVAHRELYDVRDGKLARIVLTGKSYAHTQMPDSDGNNWPIYPADYSASAADINPDGSYEGGVFHQYWRDDPEGWATNSWDWNSYDTAHPSNAKQPDTKSTSIFGGRFYGPRDGNFESIETAGFWILEPDHRVTKPWGYVFGSFGAVRTDE